jgi:hypothetical protein
MSDGTIPTSKSRADYGVSQEEFVTAWTLSDSNEEVAKRLRMPAKRVISRASLYRRKGVRLKYFDRQAQPTLNAERLNILIGEVSQQDVDNLNRIAKESFQ